MVRHELRIGVIADTHTRTFADVPDTILRALAEVDLIVHAGDFTEKVVLDGLRSLSEVKAVLGNMDSGELMRILPRHDSFTVNGKKIGLTHGSGSPWGIERRVWEMFTDADIIIFGHSHQPTRQFIGGTLLFNPGRARNSFGLLTVGEEIKAEILMV